MTSSSQDRDAAALAGPLAQVTQAGLPLASGLRALSDEVPSRAMRGWLIELAERLEHGESLGDVLRRSENRWPRYFVALIDAGQRTGQLPLVLSDCVQHVRNAMETRRQRWLALAYPLILVLAAWLLLSFLASMIAPQMRVIFADFGVQLPGLTVVMLQAGRILEFLSWWFLPVAIVASWVIWRAASRLGHARLRDAFANRLPLWGELRRASALAELCRLLSLLVRYRVPLPEAIRLAASGVHDADMRQAVHELAVRVEGGASLTEAANGLRSFPPELVNLFRWADREQEFADAMNTASELFAAKSRIQAYALTVVCEPVTEIVIGLFVAFTVIAMFMPLFKLLNDLS